MNFLCARFVVGFQLFLRKSPGSVAASDDALLILLRSLWERAFGIGTAKVVMFCEIAKLICCFLQFFIAGIVGKAGE